MTINLRSDTFSRPSFEILQALLKGDGGDDCYGESTSTNELESYCANLFGTEAAVLTTSGTMANLAGILANTDPGDEIVTDASYHVNYFESAQISRFAGTCFNTIQSLNGIINEQHIDNAINNKYRSSAASKATLICLENTINTHGGKTFPLLNMQSIRSYANYHGIRVHLDGARLLNACVALNIDPAEYVKLADTTMVSFSKGLGAPFGSILLGNSSTIQKARKYRKWLGGGLHQSGILASAALYALKNNMVQLETDHKNAKILENSLVNLANNVLQIMPTETNIIMLNVKNLGMQASEFCDLAKNQGLLLFPWDKFKVRAVTHLNVSTKDVNEATEIIKKIVLSRTAVNDVDACLSFNSIVNKKKR